MQVEGYSASGGLRVQAVPRLVHCEDGLHRELKLLELHLEDGSRLGRTLALRGVAAQPQLVHVRARADESHLCHVRPRAAIGAAGGAGDEGERGEAHLFELGAEPRVDLRLDALGLRDGEAAQREGGAGDALAPGWG